MEHNSARRPPAAPPTTVTAPPKKRLLGIDAARGLALIGLIAVHILPDSVEDTGEPTLAYTLFAGHSAALFALLAGVGLALATGGRRPHSGRALTAGRLGLVARSVVITAIALAVAALMPPEDPPTVGILLYYASFFLLAIPFLHLRPKTLFLSAAAFALVSPLLIQVLYPVLPESSAWNHTVASVIAEPGQTLADLLVTGTYPALTYMVFILTGLGLGRLDLSRPAVQGAIAAIGTAMALLSSLVSSLLLHVLGGFEALLEAEGATEEQLEELLVYGAETIPDTSAWWHATATPHSGTALADVSSLGLAMAVLGVALLVTPRLGRWLMPLVAMGSMTLTLYTAHLIGLLPEGHYDEPQLWFILHLGVAVAFAWSWSRFRGRGPLEGLVHGAVGRVRTAVLAPRASSGPSGPGASGPGGAHREAVAPAGTGPTPGPVGSTRG